MFDYYTKFRENIIYLIPSLLIVLIVCIFVNINLVQRESFGNIVPTKFRAHLNRFSRMFRKYKSQRLINLTGTLKRIKRKYF